MYLPPEPTGEVDKTLQERVIKYFALKNEGKSVNDIRYSKQYKNPDILEKLVEHCGVQEIGTNYPQDIFNPAAFQPSDYYEAIGRHPQGHLNSLTIVIISLCSGRTTKDRGKA